MKAPIQPELRLTDEWEAHLLKVVTTATQLATHSGVKECALCFCWVFCRGRERTGSSAAQHHWSLGGKIPSFLHFHHWTLCKTECVCTRPTTLTRISQIPLANSRIPATFFQEGLCSAAFSVRLLERSPGSPAVPVPPCAANKVCTAAASLFCNHLASVKAELNAAVTVRAACSFALFCSTLWFWSCQRLARPAQHLSAGSPRLHGSDTGSGAV